MATTVDVLPLIGGLTDEPVIAWNYGDDGVRVAVRVGHPGNLVWAFNERNYDAAALLAIIDGARVVALDFRGNPQAAPSEYRH